MGQVLALKNKGLYTAPNEFSEIPPGAMLRADNCSIDTEGILEPRRGFSRQIAFASGTDRARRYAFFGSTQIAAYSNGKLARKNGASWTDYSGTYNDPDSTYARLRFLKVISNLYFTTSTGVERLDSATGTPVLSGIPEGLDVNLSLTGASGYLATDNEVCYRVIWGFKDANNNIFLSSPSGRAIVTNSTGGSRDVIVTFTIPSGITTSYFYQLYRSTASGGASIEPNDELGLIREAQPVAGDITAGYVSFTDQTPDSLRGATLYSSPGQEGSLQQNDRPPQAQDVALFAGSVFYANCQGKQRKNITIVGTTGTNGINNGDTITIAGTTYTANTGGENIGTRNFLLATAGSSAQNIADTADSLVRVVNRNVTNTTVYARYTSGVNDLPGQMAFFERSLGGSSFAFTVSARGQAYEPTLPTSGTTVSSSNDDFQHQLFFAKTDKPEAVPLTNYRFVGSANDPIRRIIALNTSLMILKEKEGVFQLTGTDPSNFTIRQFDTSARILAPDTACVVNNQIWCLTDQGITTITETGVSIIGRPIEDKILQQTGTSLAAMQQYSFGVGYETDRKYILWTVSTSGDTSATQAFVYNTFTRAYTRWDIAATVAEVSSDDNKLYIGHATSEYTLQERKTYTYADFIDHSVAVTISAASGTAITLASSSGVEVGDILSQSANSSLITAIVGNVVTVADNISTWSAASASVLKAYESTAEYAPVTGANPGTSKQWPEVALLFKSARFSTAFVGFATDISGGFDEVSLAGNRVGLWGLFPWGESAWGASPTSLPIRTFPPIEKQRGSLLRVRFRIKQGYSAWKIHGFSAPYRELMGGAYKISK